MNSRFLFKRHEQPLAPNKFDVWRDAIQQMETGETMTAEPLTKADRTTLRSYASHWNSKARFGGNIRISLRFIHDEDAQYYKVWITKEKC